MAFNKESSGSPTNPAPSLEFERIRSIERQIYKLRIKGDELNTKVFELVDIANSIHYGDWETNSVAPHVIQQQKQQVATQIRQMEAQEDLNNEAMEKLKSEVSGYWEKYAASRCRTLCDAIRERLPRELRMMVFEALWEDAHHMVTEWNQARESGEVDEAASAIESWSDRNRMHCFDRRFVGPELPGEICEAWWRQSVFEFKSSDLIDWFINDEFAQHSVKDKMRTVVADLYYREFYYKRTQSRPRGRAAINTSKKGTDVDSELRYLHMLNRNTSIVVSIKKRDGQSSLNDVESRQQRFLTAVSCLFPALERLQQDGYKVTVVIGRDIEIAVGESDITVENWAKQIHAAVEALGDRHPYDTDCWPRMPPNARPGGGRGSGELVR